MMKLATLIPLVLLSACGTPRTLELDRSCPPVLTAKIDPEPVAPPDALMNEAATVFIASELLPHMRKNTERLDQGRAWCLKK